MLTNLALESLDFRNQSSHSIGTFPGAPIVTGQTIYFKIVDTQDKPFTFVGVTSCEPSTLDVDNLPNDANKLLDREEYWKVEMVGFTLLR